MFNQRKAKLLEKASQKGCNIIGCCTPENIFYATGFWGEGNLLIQEDKTTLYVSSLEYQRASQFSKDCEVVIIPEGKNFPNVIAESIRKRKIVFDDTSQSTSATLRRLLEDRVIFDPQSFYGVRVVKEAGEIEAISKASKVIDKLYDRSSEIIKPRLSEREIAAVLVAEAIRLGCDLPNYRSSLSPLIISSGEHGAYPHFDLSDRVLKPGDLVVVDLFLRYHGYFADCTRTFAVSKVSKEVRGVYENVKEAQERGVHSISPGVSGGDVDKASRSFLEKNKLGKFFVHATGHGVGLEVHEPPWIREKSKSRLEKKAVVTVEPGVYIPRKLGVRIEDTIVVSERPDVLTRFTKDLLVLS